MKYIFLIGGLLLLLLTVGCGAKKPTVMSNQPVAISGNMLVLLTPTGKPEAIETAFSEYNFENKGRASRSQNKYKFSFSASGITADGLTAKVTAHDLVSEATIVAPIKQ
jgi:hypothetical protein